MLPQFLKINLKKKYHETLPRLSWGEKCLGPLVISATNFESGKSLTCAQNLPFLLQGISPFGHTLQEELIGFRSR